MLFLLLFMFNTHAETINSMSINQFFDAWFDLKNASSYPTAHGDCLTEDSLGVERISLRRKNSDQIKGWMNHEEFWNKLNEKLKVMSSPEAVNQFYEHFEGKYHPGLRYEEIYFSNVFLFFHLNPEATSLFLKPLMKTILSLGNLRHELNRQVESSLRKLPDPNHLLNQIIYLEKSDSYNKKTTFEAINSVRYAFEGLQKLNDNRFPYTEVQFEMAEKLLSNKTDYYISNHYLIDILNFLSFQPNWPESLHQVVLDILKRSYVPVHALNALVGSRMIHPEDLLEFERLHLMNKTPEKQEALLRELLLIKNWSDSESLFLAELIIAHLKGEPLGKNAETLLGQYPAEHLSNTLNSKSALSPSFWNRLKSEENLAAEISEFLYRFVDEKARSTTGKGYMEKSGYWAYDNFEQFFEFLPFAVRHLSKEEFNILVERYVTYYKLIHMKPEKRSLFYNRIFQIFDHPDRMVRNALTDFTKLKHHHNTESFFGAAYINIVLALQFPEVSVMRRIHLKKAARKLGFEYVPRQQNPELILGSTVLSRTSIEDLKTLVQLTIYLENMSRRRPSSNQEIVAYFDELERLESNIKSIDAGWDGLLLIEKVNHLRYEASTDTLTDSFFTFVDQRLHLLEFKIERLGLGNGEAIEIIAILDALEGHISSSESASKQYHEAKNLVLRYTDLNSTFLDQGSRININTDARLSEEVREMLLKRIETHQNSHEGERMSSSNLEELEIELRSQICPGN